MHKILVEPWNNEYVLMDEDENEKLQSIHVQRIERPETGPMVIVTPSLTPGYGELINYATDVRKTVKIVNPGKPW